MNSLKSFLDDQFKIKDLGSVHYFLRLEITVHPQGYLISQHKYTTDLLTEFNCQHFSPVVTPLDPYVKLTLDMRDSLPDPSLYRRLIGKLNFLQHTRPDISFSGVLLSNSSNFSLTGYSDWASCAISHKCVTVFYVTLGGSPISWKSKNQPTISLSLAKAEYMALRKVAAEMSCQAALHIAKNPIFHERTKHIEIDYHYVREFLNFGLISLQFVSSANQLADIMTKALYG
uniref:Uncharacterized mitochondrial protein AtMg00810-like n=1 Tax=Nicotiana tabacum TaxID=4097 RepID=A0A1S3YGV4_TOBAC|nr:PREDICTED: uncharacterized mitochondrial protein AtMg00810-like [Nicotiana tabacum]